VNGGRRFQRRVGPAAAVLAILAIAALSACRILPIKTDRQQQDQGASRSTFDAASFVKSSWDEKVLPHFKTKATDLATVLDGVAKDYNGTATQYGLRHGDATGPVSFAVKGSGVVTAVNTESRAGTASIDVPTAAGTKSVTLQIGPVVRGNAIRDCLPFVSFQDFTNQIEFAQAGRALTERAMLDLKATLAEMKPGAQVQFSGAMTLTKADDPVVITPVLLHVGAGT
jgi:predicted lipoprotein